MILVQACSWPERSQSFSTVLFCSSSSPLFASLCFFHFSFLHCRQEDVSRSSGTKKTFHFYWTRVWSLATLVSDWLNALTHSCLVDLIDVNLACEDVNPNFFRLLLLLKLMQRNVLMTVWCRFGSWSLVIKSNFCSYFEQKVWSRFWSWSSGKICSWSLASFSVLMFCKGYEVESWSRFWR